MAISGVGFSGYASDGALEKIQFDPTFANRAWGRAHFFTEACSAPALGVSTLTSKIMRLAGDDAEKTARFIDQINERYKSGHDVVIALSIMFRFMGMDEPLPDAVDCFKELYQERVLCHLATSTAYLREFSHLLYPVDHKLNLQACHLIIALVDQPLGFLLNNSQRIQVKQICEQLLERKELFKRLLTTPEVHPSIVEDLQHDLGISDRDQNIRALAMRALVLTLFEPIGQYSLESDCYAVAVARHLQVVDPSLLGELICQGMATGFFVYNGVEIPINELTRSRRPTEERRAATASMDALLKDRLIIPRWIVALFDFSSLNDMESDGEKRGVLDQLLPYLGESISREFCEHLVNSFYFFRSRLFEKKEGESELSVREIIEPVSVEAGKMVNLSTIGEFVVWIKQKMVRFGLDSSSLKIDKIREFCVSLKGELVDGVLCGEEHFFLNVRGGDSLAVMNWKGLGRRSPMMREYRFDSPARLVRQLLGNSALLKRKSVVATSGGHSYRLTPTLYSGYIDPSVDKRVKEIIYKLKKTVIQIPRWEIFEQKTGISVPSVLRNKMKLSELAQQVRCHLSDSAWESCATQINNLLYLIPIKKYKKLLPPFLTQCGLKSISKERIDLISEEYEQSITSLAYMTQEVLMEENQGCISIDYLVKELSLYFNRPPTIRLGDLCWVMPNKSEVFESDLVAHYHILHEQWKLCCRREEELIPLDASFHKQLFIIDD